MTDWTGSGGTRTSARYRLMAERELHGISPTYERICLGVAADDAVLARLDELPVAKRQPNLLLATVRYLGGPLGRYPDFRDWLLGAWSEVSAIMLERRTQTNEAGRCATLLPVLCGLEQPLALLEVGASAGLCLYPDRYSYRYTTASGQRRVGRSTVELACAVSAPTPVPTQRPTVAWRAGLDVAPLDVRDEDDVRWLEALIWPEQTDRLTRLRAAVEIARREPVTVAAGDARADLAALAAQAPPDATLVVFHSAVLAYLDPTGRREFEATVRELATRRPVCWLSNEAPGVVGDTDIVTGGRSCFVLARDGSPVALAGPHGQSLDWLAA